MQAKLPGMSDTETLYLIDGSGFIYRAYFAIRAPLRALDGTPTNAVFGFIRLVLAVVKDVDPRHVAVVFENSRDTFRNEIYPPYKANRSERPEDLLAQFPLCREAARAIGIPAVELDGFEADDVIGTLARRWSARGRDVVVVTADKDFMQIVDERVTLWDGRAKRTDCAAVEERFGVPPHRVVDVLGLAGDSSDNIPGVPGIGVKTATQLLRQHGDLESLLAAAPDIKGKRGANLLEFAEQARLSVRLATIVCDAPVVLEDVDLLRRDPDPNTLATFLRSLDFKDLLDEFGLASHATVTLDRAGYDTACTRAEIEAVAAKVRHTGRAAIDLEDDDGLVGVALAWAPGAAAYVPLGHTEGPVADFETALSILRPLLEDPAIIKYSQDVKGERQALARVGIDYQGVAADVVLAAHLIDPNRHQYRLDGLAQDILGHTMISMRDVTGIKNGHLAEVTVADATRYAAEDADATLQLCDRLLPRLDELGLTPLFEALELPLSAVLGRMEARGVRVDCGILEAQSATAAEKMAGYEAEIYALAGRPFNIDSPKQLAEILFDELELPVVERTQTGPSTNATVLESLSEQHALPARVLAYRHLSKLRGTYLEKLPRLVVPETGRLHTSFKQIGAATGRIASADPNLQNIPIRTPEGREVRRAFIAEPGWKLLSADYSQIELRILAHYSADPGLLGAFADGVDVHTRTAAEVFAVGEADVTRQMRSQAKAVNFGLMYGQGAFGLARALSITQDEAKEIIARYFNRYAGVQAYYEEALSSAREQRQARTLFGRIRPLPEINTSGKRWQARAAQERLAINTPIQGTAADILKRAMVRLDARLEREGLQTRMLLTVHDELVLEVPEVELPVAPDLVREEMAAAAALRVALEVEVGVGDSWAEIHG